MLKDDLGEEVFVYSRNAVVKALAAAGFPNGPDFQEDDLTVEVASEFALWWMDKGKPVPIPYQVIGGIAGNRIKNRIRKRVRQKQAHEWLLTLAETTYNQGVESAESANSEEVLGIHRRLKVLQKSLGDREKKILEVVTSNPEMDREEIRTVLDLKPAALRKAAMNIRNQYAMLLEQEEEEQLFRLKCGYVHKSQDIETAEEFIAWCPDRLKPWGHLEISWMFGPFGATQLRLNNEFRHQTSYCLKNGIIASKLITECGNPLLRAWADLISLQIIFAQFGCIVSTQNGAQSFLNNDQFSQLTAPIQLSRRSMKNALAAGVGESVLRAALQIASAQADAPSRIVGHIGQELVRMWSSLRDGSPSEIQ
jgi:hypothetical protein